MDYYCNPAKPVDSDDYWITAKRPKPKALTPLRRAFPQAEWDILTTTIDAQIPIDDKLYPAMWLSQLSQHYQGGNQSFRVQYVTQFPAGTSIRPNKLCQPNKHRQPKYSDKNIFIYFCLAFCSRRLESFVQVSKFSYANFYAFHCAVKLP